MINEKNVSAMQALHHAALHHLDAIEMYNTDFMIKRYGMSYCKCKADFNSEAYAEVMQRLVAPVIDKVQKQEHAKAIIPTAPY